ncbi:integrase [Erwinia toletana]|uniref:Integrase n=1 Tax=Winslowiella toletana TaxID=92490 RepID=A0ABS4P2Z1_9GAMM|nr:tyrosine-type recombinase/integrase [Winslowiella toletana]MBP2167024.1 integrase [Winslowiella toletana]
MDIELIAGQRREDITLMKFSDISDERLFITQSKTGHELALPLNLSLMVASLSLSQIIEMCRSGNPSDNLIYSAVRRGGRIAGAVKPDALTSAFAEARDLRGIEFATNLPTFHNNRSLESRLYKMENDAEFAQRLLEHKNITMTKKTWIHTTKNT